MIEFVVPGEPVGKGRPRAFRFGAGVRMFTPEKTARYENMVALAARQAMQSRAPMDGPVVLDLVLITVPPSSWSVKKRAAALAGEFPPATKPDWDNVGKAICDAMNGIVFVDDKQVADAHVSKRYGHVPEARVSVREWSR